MGDSEDYGQDQDQGTVAQAATSGDSGDFGIPGQDDDNSAANGDMSGGTSSGTPQPSQTQQSAPAAPNAQQTPTLAGPPAKTTGKAGFFGNLVKTLLNGLQPVGGNIAKAIQNAPGNPNNPFDRGYMAASPKAQAADLNEQDQQNLKTSLARVQLQNAIHQGHFQDTSRQFELQRDAKKAGDEAAKGGATDVMEPGKLTDAQSYARQMNSKADGYEYTVFPSDIDGDDPGKTTYTVKKMESKGVLHDVDVPEVETDSDTGARTIKWTHVDSISAADFKAKTSASILGKAQQGSQDERAESTQAVQDFRSGKLAEDKYQGTVTGLDRQYNGFLALHPNYVQPDANGQVPQGKLPIPAGVQAWKNASDDMKTAIKAKADQKLAEAREGRAENPLVQDKLRKDAEGKTQATNSDYYNLYDQDQYHQDVNRWHDSGNFVKDVGLVNSKLNPDHSGGGGNVGLGLGLIAKTPATAIGAMGVEAVMSQMSGVMEGYKQAAISAGVSQEGQDAIQSYTQAVMSRIQFDMTHMGAKASTMRMRELMRLAIQNVPPPELEQDKFNSRFGEYRARMEGPIKGNAPKGFVPPANPYEGVNEERKQASQTAADAEKGGSLPKGAEYHEAGASVIGRMLGYPKGSIPVLRGSDYIGYATPEQQKNGKWTPKE